MGRSIGSALAAAFLAAACGDNVEVGPTWGGGGSASECSSPSDCEEASYCKGEYDENDELSGTCELIPSNRFLCGDQLLCFRDSEACVEDWGDLEPSTFDCQYLHNGCTSCECFAGGDLCGPDACYEQDGEIFATCG